jgi:hypothetical protein
MNDQQASELVEGSKRLSELYLLLGQTINLMVGLYEGKFSPETYRMSSLEAKAGSALREIVELIVKEQPR